MLKFMVKNKYQNWESNLINLFCLFFQNWKTCFKNNNLFVCYHNSNTLRCKNEVKLESQKNFRQQIQHITIKLWTDVNSLHGSLWNTCVTTGTFKCKSKFVQNENFLVKICWCTHCTCIKKYWFFFFFFWQLQTHINHSCYTNAQSLLISLAEIDNACPIKVRGLPSLYYNAHLPM